MMKMKGKYIRQVKKWHEKTHKKFASVLEQKFEGGRNEFGAKINVGQFEKGKYELGLEVRAGLEHKKFVPTLLKHLPPVDENIIQFVYTVNAKNPELVK